MSQLLFYRGSASLSSWAFRAVICPLQHPRCFLFGPSGCQGTAAQHPFSSARPQMYFSFCHNELSFDRGVSIEKNTTSESPDGCLPPTWCHCDKDQDKTEALAADERVSTISAKISLKRALNDHPMNHFLRRYGSVHASTWPKCARPKYLTLLAVCPKPARKEIMMPGTRSNRPVV